MIIDNKFLTDHKTVIIYMTTSHINNFEVKDEKSLKKEKVEME